MPYLSSYRHQGDPGVFGFLGRTFGGAVKGFVGGGPLGAVKGAAQGALARGGSKYGGGRKIPAYSPKTFTKSPQQGTPTPGFIGQMQRWIPGGATGFEAIPKGMKLNKTGYFVQNQPGNPAAGGTWVPPKSRAVSIRYRNPANSRALRRSLSRAESFGGLVKRVRKTTRKLKSL